MGKQSKGVSRARVQPSRVAERRRIKSAERFVTGLVSDMAKGRVTASTVAEIAARTVAGLDAGLARVAVEEGISPAPLGLTADVTPELTRDAQSFGDVLSAIGNAVVVSQAALDDAAIESAKQLSQTKLDVTVAIHQDLDDDGNLSGDPQLDTRTLSLSTFILPTLHQWQHVAVSMDLTVSALDATAGLKVKSGGASASVGWSGAGFSAGAAFNYSSIDVESRFKADFSQGAVRLDALLGPREEFRFPEINEFAVGPQILVTQAVTSTPAVTVPTATPATRKVTLTVKLRNTMGHEITGKSIDVRLPADLRRRMQNWTSGMSATANPIVFDLAPAAVAQPAQTYRVELKYGDLSKIVDVTV